MWTFRFYSCQWQYSNGINSIDCGIVTFQMPRAVCCALQLKRMLSARTGRAYGVRSRPLGSSIKHQASCHILVCWTFGGGGGAPVVPRDCDQIHAHAITHISSHTHAQLIIAIVLISFFLICYSLLLLLLQVFVKFKLSTCCHIIWLRRLMLWPYRCISLNAVLLFGTCPPCCYCHWAGHVAG